MVSEAAALLDLAAHLDHSANTREQCTEYDRGWIAAHRTIAGMLRQRAAGDPAVQDRRGQSG